MSSSVIICGIKCASGNIDYAKIKQMVGRAGRKMADLNPIAHIIAESDCVSDFENHVNEVPSVKSNFNKSIKFHLLSEISAGTVKTISDAEKWYSRSLASAQGIKVDFNAVFSEIFKEGSVGSFNGEFFITALGKVSVKYYFSSQSICLWKRNFETLFKNGDEQDEYAVSWALGVGAFDVPFVPFMNDIIGSFPSEYHPQEGYLAECSIWHCIFTGVSFPDCGRLKKMISSSFGRLCSALKSINMACGWKKDDYFENLSNMMIHGVSYSISKYFRYDGMTKKLALYLDENDVDSQEKMISVLDGIFDELTPQQKILLKLLRDEQSLSSSEKQP